MRIHCINSTGTYWTDGLWNTINCSTHVSCCEWLKKESATLIDNIFTNNHSRQDQTFQGLIYTDITDHFLIIHIDYDKTDNSSEMYLNRRNLSQRNRLRFCNEYNEIDTQNAFSQFHTVLRKIFNKHFPKQKIRLQYHSRKLWLTQGLEDAIKRKNKLYRNYL